MLAFFRSRNQQAIVELDLRQQLATYAQTRPKPKLTPLDRAFWVALFRLWPRWKEVLVIVKPDTVVRWHHKGFRLYWRWIIHFNVTTNPTAQWVTQQLRESFPGHSAFRYLIYDNDSIFSDEVKDVIVFSEEHLRRLLREYVSYYNAERVHTRLRDAPEGRPMEARPCLEIGRAHV